MPVNPPRRPGWSGALRALGAEPGGQLSEVGAVRAARLLRVLAEPTRVGVMARLGERPAGRELLATALGREVGEVVYHLHALIDAGLVTASATGVPGGVYELTEQGRRTLPVLALLGLPDV